VAANHQEDDQSPVTNRGELEEIAHTGGKVTFDVKVEEGRVSYAVGWSHQAPTAATVFGVFAIPQGAAVAWIDMGGIGTPWNPPPVPGCYPVFIASDQTGMFGHQCPACKGYWRAMHSTLCPYCAFKPSDQVQFLTDAQQRYVQQYCGVLSAALDSGKPGEYTIDMDAVASAAGKDTDKPPFYYAEQRQQNLFECNACGERTDVFGKYAYCSSCGTRNDLQEFQTSLRALRERINAGGAYEACAKDAVGAFDSFAGQYAKQLLNRVPITPARRGRLERAHFHNLDPAAEIFRNIFDIDILAGIPDEDIAFARLLFHRRHVYEHTGGEADKKYVQDSGDKVRVKQALRETQESAHRIANVVQKMAGNLHFAFHQIFPPLEEPIKWHQRKRG
jgi:hypothetical protein